MMTDAQQTGEISDLLIIGGGPTGLFAAFYAGLRKMSVTIVDSLEVLGGQLVTLYPEKDIYDVAGFPKVLAKDLASNLVEQALQYHPRICLGEQVMTLEFDEGESCYNVTTTSSKHRSRAILIAAGIGSFTPKTLSLPGASDYLGRGLHYFVKSMEPFKGRRVLIVGGGDSAVDWANMLSPLADKVTLIHRRDQFRAHEDSVIKMRAGRTQIQTFCELKSIGGKSCVDCATIYDNRSKAEQ
jgi:thioredoxin reductase (NADPH)